MVEYCRKSTEYIIEHNGELYGIEKPTIKTRFCFGHGMYLRSTPEEEANANRMVELARESEEYFVNENLKEISNRIDELQKILEKMNLNWAEGNHPIKMVVTGSQYTDQPDDCMLRYFAIVNTFDRCNGSICYDKELVEKLISGYKEVKNSFTKRLKTYLNRYGLTKVEAWSYMID